jgi:formylglycine-generating enzyme required for sulfatase activity
MRFCIDRFEWPNRAGALPAVLVSWQDARQACEAVDKRLCEEAEWTFACEGADMLPYSPGYTRPTEQCVIDRPYRAPRIALSPASKCSADRACSAELARLDQRKPSDPDSRCLSPFGVTDMNGNVNEWVNSKAGRYPHRGALKGGWWGPVRNRCRPAVRKHREDHWGYEIGFRCCRSLSDTAVTHPGRAAKSTHR